LGRDLAAWAVLERLFMRRREFLTTYPDALAPDENHAIRALAASYNDFGQTIFASLIEEPGNVVYSPYSAGVAFSMAMSGARGTTQAEFLAVMRLPDQPSETEAANGKLTELIASYAEERPDLEALLANAYWSGQDEAKARTEAGQPITELAAANLLALTSPFGRLLVAPEYRELLRTAYNAEVFENAAPATIDAWATARTRGHIPHVATWDEDSSPDFVLLNAVYFNGRWACPFQKYFTEPLPFTTAAGRRIDVPTMRQTIPLHYLRGEGFKSVWLPYESEAPLGMAIVMPDPGVAVAALAARLAATGLPALADQLLQTRCPEVHIQLPRFSTRFDASLKEPARAAGLRLPFEREGANFGGVTGRSDEDLLYVDDVRQQANLDVTEEGTLASAVTVVTVYATGLVPRDPPTPFLVDCPFLFYILDHKSGAILFQGRIDDPRAI
jgi:serpin B